MPIGLVFFLNNVWHGDMLNMLKSLIFCEICRLWRSLDWFKQILILHELSSFASALVTNDIEGEVRYSDISHHYVYMEVPLSCSSWIPGNEISSHFAFPFCNLKVSSIILNLDTDIWMSHYLMKISTDHPMPQKLFVGIDSANMRDPPGVVVWSACIFISWGGSESRDYTCTKDSH